MKEDGEGQERSLMLDGNAVAGILYEIFSAEMSGAPCECAACGREGAIGTLTAYTRAPGVVLRCPACENVMLRIVRTSDYLCVEMRGSAYFKVPLTT
jgi:hypothetical protein